MECQSCNNIFTTKNNLKAHQKTAKYCLKLRDMENLEYVCEKCDKKFSTNTNLKKHIKNCKKKDEKLILDLKEKLKHAEIEIDTYKLRLKDHKKQHQESKITIKELQDKLENIALQAVNKPSTKNTQINNYIQQLQPVTEDHFKDKAQFLTIDHILNGPAGYAEFAYEYHLKDRVLCVDFARRKIKFKDKDGHVITDPEMTTLATKFFQSIKDRNKELIIQYGNDMEERFGDEMETIVKILDYKMAVDKGCEGEKTDFHHDFIKHICSKNIRENI